MLDGDNVRHASRMPIAWRISDAPERWPNCLSKWALLFWARSSHHFAPDRQMMREFVGDGEFLEVFIDTPLEECVRRDPKGLYAKAPAGAIPNFTGVNSPYETPEAPELLLETRKESAERLADRVIDYLRAGQYLT